MKILRIALAGLMLAGMQAITPAASAHGFGGGGFHGGGGHFGGGHFGGHYGWRGGGYGWHGIAPRRATQIRHFAYSIEEWGVLQCGPCRKMQRASGSSNLLSSHVARSQSISRTALFDRPLADEWRITTEPQTMPGRISSITLPSLGWAELFPRL